MGCRVVKTKQRVKVFQCLLGNVAAHLLGFVQNDDRTVRLDNINRTARTELIALGVDDSCFLGLAVLFEGGGKCLGIDNHYIDTRTGRKIVQLVQVRTVVDEETCLLAVVLHKVVGSNLKGLLYTFTDGDRRHNNDELAPTVSLVEFEHSLDIHIGLTSTSFHLNIKRTFTQCFYKTGGHFDVVLVL